MEREQVRGGRHHGEEFHRILDPVEKDHRQMGQLNWQYLRSHKAYLTINTIGLAVGIGACLLVFLLIQYETSFDNFHKNKERIYRVVAATKTQTGMHYSKASAFPVAQALRIDY